MLMIVFLSVKWAWVNRTPAKRAKSVESDIYEFELKLKLKPASSSEKLQMQHYCNNDPKKKTKNKLRVLRKGKDFEIIVKYSC